MSVNSIFLNDFESVVIILLQPNDSPWELCCLLRVAFCECVCDFGHHKDWRLLIFNNQLPRM